MYHPLSRVLYRRLAPLLRDDPRQGGLSRQRRALLDACETTAKRLATDPDYFAHPARFLFGEVRCLFALDVQLRVRMIVDLEVSSVMPVLERLRSFERRNCDAFSRAGTPCRREAARGARYCPSHRHLEEVLAPPQHASAPAAALSAAA